MLDPERPTWPKALQSSGYTTALFGKWHMKTKPTGFDAWEVFSGQGHYYNPDLYGPKGVRRVEGHSTDIVTDLALDWLESRDAETILSHDSAQGASPQLEAQLEGYWALSGQGLCGACKFVRRL